MPRALAGTSPSDAIRLVRRRDDRIAVIRDLRSASPAGQRWLQWIQAAELSAVCLCVCAQAPGRLLAILCNRLGNGWIYPMLAGGLGLAGSQGRTVALVATVNIVLLHCVYRPIKTWSGRKRPFEVHPTLRPLVPPFDVHSFPSGHVMTLTAALVPIVVAFPGTAFPLAVLWLLIAWSRMACAHHYPTDVLAGALLGLSVALPMSIYWLAR